MATFRSQTTSVFNSGGTGTVALPTGSLAGDLVVAQIVVFDALSNSVTVTGWDFVRSDNCPAGGNILQTFIYKKILLAADITAGTMSATVPAHFTDFALTCYTVSNEDVIGAGSGNSGTSASAQATGITAVAGTILDIYSTYDVATTTGPAGMTVRVNGYDAGSLSQYEEAVSAGATGTRTATLAASSNWTAALIQIGTPVTVGAGTSSGLGLALASAIGGTKYTASPGVAIVDFGQGDNVAQVVITDQTAITSGAYCEAFLMGDVTNYHNAYEHLIVDMDVRCSDIVAGVGFTITATSPWKLTSQFVVHYVWSN